MLSPFRGFQYTQFTVQKPARAQIFSSMQRYSAFSLSDLLHTHTECISPRTRSVFHRAGRFLHSTRAGDFLRSVAGRTREHAKRVSSRRNLSPFYTCTGRERSLSPFRGPLLLTASCGHPHAVIPASCRRELASTPVPIRIQQRKRTSHRFYNSGPPWLCFRLLK